MIVVEEARASDLDGVVALELACFGHEAWSRGMLASELDRPAGSFLVARAHPDAGADPDAAQGRAAAVERGRAAPRPLNPTPSIVGYAIALRAGDVLEVLKVAVDPAGRRCGAGRRLVAALHAAAGWADEAWLEVRTDNPGARALYLACGYEDAGVRKRYYADGCDAWVMRRTLRETPG